MIKKILGMFLGVGLLATSVVLAKLPNPIRFATEATYPPFEYIDETGTMKGFDMDIANALCAQIQTQCSFSNQAFNSLIPSLKLGKFDALIASLGITAERQKQVSFTTPYYQPSASFVAPLAKNYRLNNLVGKIVGAQQGSTFERYLINQYRSNVLIKTYASIQDAFLDLVSGRVDMVIADTPIAQAWLKQNARDTIYGIVDQPIVDPTYFGDGYGIAVRKDDVELLNALNRALAAIKANGTYAKIIKKYF